MVVKKGKLADTYLPLVHSPGKKVQRGEQMTIADADAVKP